MREALVLSKIRGVRVMHDPTEGGVINACWELGEASGLGVEVWADNIPIARETSEICSRLKLDPLKLMSSGCLLAVVAPRSVDTANRSLRRVGVRSSLIGRMTRLVDGRKYILNGRSSNLVAVPRDELYRLG